MTVGMASCGRKGVFYRCSGHNVRRHQAGTVDSGRGPWRCTLVLAQQQTREGGAGDQKQKAIK
jgi:hypothetical protein